MPRHPGDGWIDWTAPSRAIHDLVRAVTHPYPGAFTMRARTRLMVWRTRMGDAPVRFVAVPGTVVRRSARAGGAWVSTGDGAIELLRVQLDGEPERPAADVLRSGDRLGADIPALLEMIRTR
jgi:methionyl-tRNA formyltransferase